MTATHMTQPTDMMQTASANTASYHHVFSMRHKYIVAFYFSVRSYINPK